MHYVLIASHPADICPTSNATTRNLMRDVAPTIPSLAEQAGVRIVAGPYVNREHNTIAIVEADSSEKVDAFLMASRLPQWNSVHILPSIPIQEALAVLDDQPALF